MLRCALATILMLGAPAAFAAECPYVSGTKSLYFVTPVFVAVADTSYKDSPYACTTSTLGTGVAGRMLHCSDDFEGPLTYDDQAGVTFRGATWEATCPDNTPMDIEMGN